MTPKVNVPLLRKAVEWAEAEAAKPIQECGWYQPGYMVNTRNRDGSPRSFSFGEFSVAQRSDEINGCGTAFCIAGWVYWQATGLTDVDAEEIDTFAMNELGISEFQASRLFSGANGIKRVRKIAEDIAGQRL